MKKSKLLVSILLLAMLCGCSSSDMTIIDENGKAVEVSSAGNETYTFNLPSGQTNAVGWDNPFIDVKEGAWYYDTVRYCYENKLMNGTSSNTFSPDMPTSRAMIVATLWRMEGSPAVGKNTFTDVPEDQYYANAVAWAASQKIVSGYSETSFAPDQAVTREQLAAILYRFAEYNNQDLSAESSLDTFVDARTSSDYAKDALSWAVSHGIINGTGDHQLTPQGDATRAQVATILMNLLETST